MEPHDATGDNRIPGLDNSALWQLGLRAHGHAISWLIYSKFSVALVLFYAWVPFVALPIFVVLDTTGEFIAPLLVGGPSSQLFGNSIQAFFSDTPDWQYGSVLALTLVVVVLVMLALFGRFIGGDLTQPEAEAA